jgi:RimK family alpha-L-glutamate ligase
LSPCIAIVTDEPGWHGRQLRRAFSARGVDSHYVSLQDSRITLGKSADIYLPEFDTQLPDAVFVRGVPGGSLEQVVFYLNVLHALKALGVPVYNDGRAIERSVDKSLTSLIMQQAGLPTPPTWICTDPDKALTITKRETGGNRALVCKPLFGSQGKGVCLVRSTTDLPPAESVNHVWYLQRFIGELDSANGLQLHHQASDWRVFVVGGKAVAAMQRRASGLVANLAQGGRCHAALIDGKLRQLAEHAVDSLDMAYAGVDLMRDASGSWWVIEVNSIPAWRGLQSVTRFDIAACLADDLLRRCESNPIGEVAI